MSNILTATVTIKGTRPLIWNAFTLDAIPLKKREKTGVAGNNPEEWKRTVLVTETGQLYLKPSYIFGCLRDGAKYTREGRSSLQTKLSASLQVLNQQVLVDRYLPEDWSKLTTDPAEAVYIDVRSVKNPTTRGRNIRYRLAASPNWRASFRISWDVTVINQGQMKAILYDSGQLCGLGDGRQIGFGRFEIVAFEIDATQ